MQISQKAFDLCLSHEVISKAYYIKHFQKPEWPGVQSGVTVAIGYDLGQAKREKIVNDWSGKVSADMILVMASCSGLVGQAGKAKLAEVKNRISIPWEAALDVFANRDVPNWTSEVLRRVPGADKLTPTCLGILFDLAYNRGHSWSLDGDRYLEMRAIKSAVGSGNLVVVPGLIRSMKRIWKGKGVDGLLRRCDERAALWEWALKNETIMVGQSMGKTETMPTMSRPPVVAHPTPAAPDPDVPQNAGKARTMPAATSPAQNATAITIAAGTAAAASQAHGKALVAGDTAIGIGLAGALVAAVVWYVWFRNRNPT